MKNIQKSVHFSPSVLIYFEQLSKQKKCSFSESVNTYLEQSLSKDKSEMKLDEIADEQKTIRELIVQLVDVIQDMPVKK